MKGKIALEEHFLLKGFQQYSFDFLDTAVFDEIKRRLLDTDRTRIEEMDRAGIETAILSFTAPGIQAEPDALRAVDVAQRANDLLAEQIIARSPDRFRGFAALPLQDAEAAADELTRAVRRLGFVGAMVNGYSNLGDARTGVYLDEARYEPFWDRVEELDVPIYLHPRDPLPDQQRIYEGHPELLGAAWAFGVETATHALRLIMSGLFDRHPGLTLVLGHLGEMLPFMIWRVEHRFAFHGGGKKLLRPVSAYLRDNMYITTSGNFRTQSLIDCMLELSADRLLFSTDYPYESMQEAADWFDACSISEIDRVKIGRTNAARLFHLDASARAADVASARAA